jgi:hypothetical protein
MLVPSSQSVKSMSCLGVSPCSPMWPTSSFPCAPVDAHRERREREKHCTKQENDDLQHGTEV